MYEVIDLVAIFDFIVKLAAGIVTLSAAAAIIIPRSRNWILKKLTASEETEKRVARLLVVEQDVEHMKKTTSKTEKRVERLVVVEKDVDAMKKTTSVLLHDRFFQACLFNLKRGYTTNVDLENIDHLWKQYSGYGHNGYGEKLYNKVNELEVRVNEYL